jgi:hypothetical protein
VRRAATYLYQDGPRYWHSTQPTVTKLAEDRAEQLKRNPDSMRSTKPLRARSRFGTGIRVRCTCGGRMNREIGLWSVTVWSTRLLFANGETTRSGRRCYSRSALAPAVLHFMGRVTQIPRSSTTFSVTLKPSVCPEMRLMAPGVDGPNTVVQLLSFNAKCWA